MIPSVRVLYMYLMQVKHLDNLEARALCWVVTQWRHAPGWGHECFCKRGGGGLTHSAIWPDAACI